MAGFSSAVWLGLRKRSDLLPQGGKQERGEDEFHGVGGPLNVTDAHYKHEIIDAIIEVAVQAGIPRNRDFNGANQEGAGYYQATVGKGRRWSAATAYLKPARGRRNLAVKPNAHATQIVIENGRAVGVSSARPVAWRSPGPRAR